MSHPVHPNAALFAGEKPFPIIPACEHFAGSEKLILKALAQVETLGPVFNVTCDCEDGAPAGREKAHAEMIVRLLGTDANHHKMAGARIHDYSHPAWRQDVDILVGGAGERLAYLTIPKCTEYAHAAEMIDFIQHIAQMHGIEREIPIHVLIETHGALRDVQRIATLPWLQVLDFGLMDFVSGHHGAIPGNAMKSPGQFEHPLIVRAKADITAAALANGVVPAHNVTTELQDVAVIRHDAERARREFGYLRMWSIHPNQILPIIAAMQPDFSEVEEAAEILIAAQDAAWGPIQHKGRLHDRASYRYYWELLQRARNTGMELPEAARQRFFTPHPVA